MTDGSNSAGRIAELRRRIASNKGKANRAYDTIAELQWRRRKCLDQIRIDQDEIEAMGGKVKR